MKYLEETRTMKYEITNPYSALWNAQSFSVWEASAQQLGDKKAEDDDEYDST